MTKKGRFEMSSGSASFVFRILHQLVKKKRQNLIGAVGRQQDGNQQTTKQHIAQCWRP
jgi:hypothetical protein